MLANAGIALILLLVVAGLVAFVMLEVRSIRNARFIRNLRPLDADDVYEYMVQLIARTRATGGGYLRAYVLGCLRGLHESGRIDDEEYLTLSASVADWIVKGP